MHRIPYSLSAQLISALTRTSTRASWGFMCRAARSFSAAHISRSTSSPRNTKRTAN